MLYFLLCFNQPPAILPAKCVWTLTSVGTDIAFFHMGNTRSRILYINLLFGLVYGADDIPPKGPFPITPKVFHHPDEVVFNTRPYNMDLFVDFDESEIASASVFIKTDAMDNYTEYPLDIIRARYRHQFSPLFTPAKAIEYFFVVSLHNHAIYAAPLDKNGYINIVKRTLEDPAEYFKRRLAQRR